MVRQAVIERYRCRQSSTQRYSRHPDFRQDDGEVETSMTAEPGRENADVADKQIRRPHLIIRSFVFRPN
ncbi:MAG: hypothetical protein AAGJ87_12170 [Pseudomonadota bacterium]